MNKKGLLPRNWIVLVVIISMLLVASSYWITSWDTAYTPLESPNLTSSYSSLSEISSKVNTMERRLLSQTEVSKDSIFEFFVQGGYNVLLSVLSIPGVIRNFIMDIGGQFGIPRPFVDGVLVLIVTAAVFGIIGVIFRRKV